MLSTNELQEEHYACSVASSNETADNITGSGRIIGNVYLSLGRRLERVVRRATGNMDASELHEEHYPCSSSSTNETVDDLPGPSRIFTDSSPRRWQEYGAMRAAGSMGIDELHEEYYACSNVSSNETADNLPGPGRILGNVYVSLGRRVEHGVARVAVRMGIGPQVIANKIQKIEEDSERSLFNPKEYRKLRKYGKQSAKYLK